MTFNIENLVRGNIRNMKAYSSARHEYTGDASIFLDANENSFGSPLSVPYNRYPDPLQTHLKEKIAAIKGVSSKNIFLGNGSDEAIDLLMRIFCEPGHDNIIILPPTYGMYEVCAEMNNVKIKKVPLLNNFQPDIDTIAETIDLHTKLIFLCSPNNPTGNNINRNDIEILLNNLDGIVVIDEAYINYSKQRSFVANLDEYPNLVILQTFSKAWGLAGLRLGMAFSSDEIIAYMNKVKYPYNISTATQKLAESALNNLEQVNNWIRITVEERNKLSLAFKDLNVVEHVYPSDANFILIKVKDAGKIYNYLVEAGIIVRNRSNVLLCENCLRITIGTPEENNKLLEKLKVLNTI